MKNRLSAAAWKPIRAAADAVVSVLFPAPCRVCRRPLSTASRVPVCAECLGALRRIVPPFCRDCGRPFPPILASSVSPVCHACLRHAYRFDLARNFAYYDDNMVRLLTLLKHEPAAPLAAWFAERIEEVVRAEPAVGEVDWVIPVPLDRTRFRERGYNQAELIARPLASRLRRPLSTRLLRRLHPRPPKLKLSRRERWETVRGAFEVPPRTQLTNARVLLVDDVLTSGATLDACARALRSAGAATVRAVTVARVLPRWETPVESARPHEVGVRSGSLTQSSR